MLWNSVPYLEARIPFRSGLLCCHDNKNDHPTFITKQPGRRFCEAIFLLPGFFALTSMVFVSQELILKEKKQHMNEKSAVWSLISNQQFVFTRYIFAYVLVHNRGYTT